MTKETENDKNKSADKLEKVRLLGTEPGIFQGKYSNATVLRHTKDEFIVDFVFNFDDQAHLVSRILMSPAHAKAVSKTLELNVKAYEETYGPISE